MLLLPDDRLEERRRAVAPGAPLAPLFDSLAGDLEPLLASPAYLPGEKALLSRSGGRCEVDGTALDFDPSSPHSHRCPACGRVHSGELHHRAWVMPYQLWLAERVLQAALFHLLRGDARHATFARETLRAYAERYPGYPNRDNVLGPSRLFFSTYLESIWLLQIAIAADLLDRAGDATTVRLARERIVEPAAAIIAAFDEGMSNRQVWNNAALLASAALLGDGVAFDRLITGASGLLAHLRRALLEDGTWYEGENYHQFALRGLWYGVVLLESRGGQLPPDLAGRLQRAFAAPFLTALPDFTLPSRKDSQYAVSLRQWRMAELTELGFARRRDPVLADALARSYEAGHERRDTGRARSTADVERNVPPSALSRADLGWRALLHALPDLPTLRRAEQRSALLESQGYAVFRREGGIYVGFEFGQSGGGHGHPDRLGVTLYQGPTRWLDDLGTGSYVDPSLHWYRSTLAHNAPLVNGRSQPVRDGALLAYDEREGLGWIVGELRIPDQRVRLERAIVVAPDYLIDELRWEADTDVQIDLPWHFDPFPHQSDACEIDGGTSPADGFPYLGASTRIRGGIPMLASRPDGRLQLVTRFERGASLFLTDGPGQPASARRRFSIVRVHGRRGVLRSILSLTGSLSLQSSSSDDVLWVEAVPGERHGHRRDERGWHVQLEAAGARSSIDLAGFRAPASEPSATQVVPIVPMSLHRATAIGSWLSDMSPPQRKALLLYHLGEAHYRPSEQPWREAGSPSATVGIGVLGSSLVVFAHVQAGDALFAAIDAINPYDNEHPDTMRAGIQLYVSCAGSQGAWMLVPDSGRDGVRIRPIVPSELQAHGAAWRRTDDGYELRAEVTLPSAVHGGQLPLVMDVIINETVAGRERRRGQLVMSGARGESVYLRGDRHPQERLIPMRVVP